MKKYSGFSWLELVMGLLLIVLGVLVFVRPDLALTSMVFVYGLAAVVMGVADIVLYVQVERYVGFGPLLSLIAGVLSVMSGIMLVVYPRTGVLVLTVLFPIWFIAHCVSRFTHLHYIRLSAGDGRYYFALIVNIVGLFLGCLMLLDPLFTLTTIRCFASVYLVLLGVDGIVMALGGTGIKP